LPSTLCVVVTSMIISPQCLAHVGEIKPKFNCMMKNGAGEGIRTLDPDLGKVVLYP
jgi:hypothetical protein